MSEPYPDGQWPNTDQAGFRSLRSRIAELEQQLFDTEFALATARQANADLTKRKDAELWQMEQLLAAAKLGKVSA